MLIIDVQRAGPSTGMPTKTEQSDLLMALYGRHGESPLPIVCATTPAQCFDATLEAVADRRALPHAGDPAHRPLPRELLGAVADPRRRHAADDRPALRDAERRRTVRALRARRRRRAPVGGARHARAPAPDRRHREVAAERRDLLRGRQPPADDRPASRADRRDRGGAARRRRRSRRRAARARLGLELRHAARGRAAPARGRPPDRARPVPPPQPAAGEHRRGARALQARARRRDERRPAREGAAQRVRARHRQLRDHRRAARCSRRSWNGSC